jgi:hypothetical protein
MKRLLLLLLVSLSVQVHAQDSACDIEPKAGSGDFNVFSASGNELGYISPNADGSWFVWLSGVGAVNDNFVSKEAAINYLCGQQLKAEKVMRPAKKL